MGCDTNEETVIRTTHGWWIFSWTDTQTDNTFSGQTYWLIDAFKQNYRDNKYYVFWIPFPHTQYVNFVHCNFGKGGKGNGWYYSGVFDMDKVMTDDEVNAKGITTTIRSDEGNYVFRLKMIHNIFPDPKKR